MTTFEKLSNEIIVLILEYFKLEEFITLFGELNARLAYLTFEHPWVKRHYDVHSTDNKTLQERLEFLQNLNLIPNISTLQIRPYSIFHTIEKFHELQPIDNFVNLRALSFKHVTLDEAEQIFTDENLSKLLNLTRLNLIFSIVQSEDDYQNRLEIIIAKILRHSPLERCYIESARAVYFSEVNSPVEIQYFNINYTNFESLYRLFQYTPKLRHLTAKIAIHNESKIENLSVPATLRSLKIILSYPAFDDLKKLLENLPKLEKFHLITHSINEPPTMTSSWSQLINDYLRGLTQFRREANVPIEQIETYMQAYHWTNGWKFQEKTSPHGSTYSRVCISNIRY